MNATWRGISFTRITEAKRTRCKRAARHYGNETARLMRRDNLLTLSCVSSLHDWDNLLINIMTHNVLALGWQPRAHLSPNQGPYSFLYLMSLIALKRRCLMLAGSIQCATGFHVKMRRLHGAFRGTTLTQRSHDGRGGGLNSSGSAKQQQIQTAIRMAEESKLWQCPVCSMQCCVKYLHA